MDLLTVPATVVAAAYISVDANVMTRYRVSGRFEAASITVIAITAWLRLSSFILSQPSR